MATANNEFFEALSALEKERGLPEDYLIDKIKAAIVIAVKKDYEVEDDNVVVDIDPELGAFRASLLRDIVEEVENPHTQVSLEDAQKVRKSYKVGQRMVTPLKTKEFGRIAAQTAKHVIRQGLREGERNLQCSEMQSRAHELIAATVVSIDPERGNVVLDLGKGGSAVLPRNEQVPGETFTEGQTVQVYVVDVLATDRGPRVTISRTHPGLVKRMFELEVPEIYDGTVEVKAIAREAGARTKLAVWSKNPDVDPVGACIGARGVRVEKIVQYFDSRLCEFKALRIRISTKGNLIVCYRNSRRCAVMAAAAETRRQGCRYRTIVTSSRHEVRPPQRCPLTESPRPEACHHARLPDAYRASGRPRQATGPRHECSLRRR